jgi:hypothetical protein
MEPREDDALPALALRLAAPEELEGAVEPAWEWRGGLGDGETLTIEGGAGGELLFAYGEQALFLWEPAASTLRCAPREPADPTWLRVLLHRILPDLSMALGRETLHATAVAGPAGVIAVAGPSGSGKSTLAAELVRRGRPFFTDDVLVLEATGDGVIAHPGSPHANFDLEGPAVVDAEGLGEILATLAGERWTAIRDHAVEPRPVAAIVALDRGGEPGVEPLAAGPLALAPFMIGLPEAGPEREARRFALFANLAESARLLRLGLDLEATPAAGADALEAALEIERGPVGSPA